MGTMRRLLKFALPALLLIAAGAGAARAQSGEPAKAAGALAAAEEKMARRFPQPVRVGFLIGRAVLDNEENTIGHVRRVVRTAEGKIELIVGYSRWFAWLGWWERPVAVPVPLVAMLGPYVFAIDMPVAEFQWAPEWTAGESKELGADEVIQVALTKTWH